MIHYIEQTSTIQWHVAVNVASCMVSTCVVQYSFCLHGSTRLRRRVVNGKLHFHEEPCATLCASWELKWRRVNNSWYSRPYSFRERSPQRFWCHTCIRKYTHHIQYWLSAFQSIPRFVEVGFLVNFGHDLWGNLRGIFVASQKQNDSFMKTKEDKEPESSVRSTCFPQYVYRHIEW